MRLKSVAELPEQHRAAAQRQLNGEKPLPGIARYSGLDGLAVMAADVAVSKLPKSAKPSKYRNVRVELEGEVYDSRKEYEFHQVLKDRKRLGEVVLILRQVPFRLEGGVVYRADYVTVTVAAPHFEVWDVKGFDTRSSINKRKQVLARYGVEVRLWPPRPPKGE
jgi:hypothetical protein